MPSRHSASAEAIAAGGLLAGRTLGGGQTAVQRLRGLIQFDGQAALQPHVAPLRALVVPHQVGQHRGQHLTQPAEELRLADASELSKVAGGAEESILHHIGGVHLALQAPADLHSGQHRQVAAIGLQ